MIKANVYLSCRYSEEVNKYLERLFKRMNKLINILNLYPS